jgi:hypothetical protein
MMFRILIPVEIVHDCFNRASRRLLAGRAAARNPIYTF